MGNNSIDAIKPVQLSGTTPIQKENSVQSSDPKVEATASKIFEAKSKIKMDQTSHTTFDELLCKGDFSGALRAAAKMTTFSQSDEAYGKILDAQLAQGDLLGAFDTAGKMSSFSRSDAAYGKILDAQLAKEDLLGASSTAGKMSSFSQSDAAYGKILDALLAKEDLLGASRVAGKMSSFSRSDAAYGKILDALLAKGDLLGASDTAGKMSSFSQSDKAYGKVLDAQMAEGDLLGASRTADKMSTFSKSDAAFSKVVEAYLAKGDVEGLFSTFQGQPLRISVIIKCIKDGDFDETMKDRFEKVCDEINPWSRRIILNELKAKYTELGDAGRASKLDAKIDEVRTIGGIHFSGRLSAEILWLTRALGVMSASALGYLAKDGLVEMGAESLAKWGGLAVGTAASVAYNNWIHSVAKEKAPRFNAALLSGAAAIGAGFSAPAVIGIGLGTEIIARTPAALKAARASGDVCKSALTGAISLVQRAKKALEPIVNSPEIKKTTNFLANTAANTVYNTMTSLGMMTAFGVWNCGGSLNLGLVSAVALGALRQFPPLNKVLDDGAGLFNTMCMAWGTASLGALAGLSDIASSRTSFAMAALAQIPIVRKKGSLGAALAGIVGAGFASGGIGLSDRASGAIGVGITALGHLAQTSAVKSAMDKGRAESSKAIGYLRDKTATWFRLGASAFDQTLDAIANRIDSTVNAVAGKAASCTVKKNA